MGVRTLSISRNSLSILNSSIVRIYLALLTGPVLESSSVDVSAASWLRVLFNGFLYAGEKVGSRLSVRTGDVGGLSFGKLRVGEDVKKLGGLEVGTGGDGRG